jgi:hypothetical protein
MLGSLLALLCKLAKWWLLDIFTEYNIITMYRNAYFYTQSIKLSVRAARRLSTKSKAITIYVHKINTIKCDRIWEKGPFEFSCYSRIFILKRLYLRNHSSYELETWYKRILLHLLWIPSHAHFLCSKNRRFTPVFGASSLGIGGLL